MRTTIELDADILEIVKDLAEERRQSLGRAVSDTFRQALQPEALPALRASDAYE